MSKEKVDVYICPDGVLIHEKNKNMIHQWFKSLESIKIIQSKRTIQQIIEAI